MATSKAVSRKDLDRLLIGIGFVLLLLLLTLSWLSSWANGFATDAVKSQLVQEKIFFPAAGSKNFDAAEYPGLQQYAGQQVDNGDKAKAYADEYIWHHMMKASGGKTYAEVSAAAMASPTDTKLTATKAVLFQGDSLRSSLLTAYAFSRFSIVAQTATQVFLAGSIIMSVLVILGLNHLRKIS